MVCNSKARPSPFTAQKEIHAQAKDLFFVLCVAVAVARILTKRLLQTPLLQIEPEVHDIPILDEVLLAFDT